VPALPPDVDGAGSGTLVIEDGVIPRRVRRPVDLLRFATAVVSIAAIVLVSYFLTGTSAGIDRDIVNAGTSLPSLLLVALTSIAGIGVLALPAAAAIDLIVRRRARQLTDAIGAAVLATALGILLTWAVSTFGSEQLIIAITGVSDPTGRGAVNPVIAALVAFITVARLLGRGRWGAFAVVTVVALCVVPLTSGSSSAVVVAISVLLGWAVGLATRYTLGTPTTRPSGMQVAEALDRSGFPVTVLRANKNTSRGRMYDAHTRAGERLRVVVYDRDKEGAGLAQAAWRQVRLRTDPENPSVFSMRAQIEHAALMSYAAAAAGGRIPRLRAVVEVGPDSTLLAYDHIDGRTFDLLEHGEVTDADVERVYRAVRTLHDDQIVHRALVPEQIIKGDDGSVWLAGVQHGAIASSDVQERLDLAELLCTAALLTDAPRAVATGARVFGADRIVKALPALQPVALSSETRRRLRGRKELLKELRDELMALRPTGAAPEQLELRRFRPRTIVSIVLGSVAAYVLLSQFANQDLVGLFRKADWRWGLLALLLSAITFVGAGLSLSGFVPEKLSHLRTFLAQLAAGFATLVSPPTVGAVAVNVRYLQKSGLHPALAAASVGVSQVFAFFVHISLLFICAVSAGRQADLHISPPKWALYVVIGVVAVLGLLLLFGPVRKTLVDRVRPILTEVGPRMLTIAQRPWKIAEGVGGILLLNGAFAVCMIACCEAFGAGNENWPAIAVVYLAGSTLGQAAPTPGGLGAVELAYVAGLTAAGVDSGIAVSATLLFRILTFWLPTVPGYFSFTWLQRQGAL
jgi:glycosyltransferase 2 family protein